MNIPNHIREEIVQMLPYPDYDDYIKFANQYFNELVAVGVFLNDVKFTDISLKGQRIVLFAAARLWISAKKKETTGII